MTNRLIGDTPQVRLRAMERACGLAGALYAKLEMQNLSGSVKARIAEAILDDAEAMGRLQPGGTVIEPTSGNTGIGLAALCAQRGYRLVLTMPETMSAERRTLLLAYGAQLVLTPGAQGMRGAIERAKELVATTPQAILAGQFENPQNPLCHYRTTGPEIARDTKGEVAAFVAGIGTGGTISGVGRFLKEQNEKTRIIGVEPTGSAVLSGGAPGPHGLMGIGAGFVPQTLAREILDEVHAVSEAEAYQAARLLAQQEGLLCGISGGAALFVAMKVAKEAPGENIIVLLPDGGERYLSTDLFCEKPTDCAE